MSNKDACLKVTEMMKGDYANDHDLQDQLDSMHRHTVMGYVFTINDRFHVFLNTETKGVVLDQYDGSVEVCEIDESNEIFDIWHEGHFVDHGDQCYDEWHKWMDARIDKVILDGMVI